MDEVLRWFYNLVAVVLMAVIGWLVKEMRALAANLTAEAAGLRTAITVGDNALHERVNKVRDEYVRRDDLDGHLQRIDGNVNELRREIADGQREMTKRLDAIVERLTTKR